jgi:phosphatidylserine/phosphatidylglycerophosphate/cardiolipin synthase-like enzyme
MSEFSLSRGPEASNFHRDALDSARSHVDAAIYKFRDPDILSALLRALDRGVRVRLVLDRSQSRSRKCLGSRALHAGAELRYYGEGRRKLHVKIVLVDGLRAYTGSANWTRGARGRNQELQMLLDDDKAVDQLQLLFEQLWAEAEESSP